jgi:hypothetical protein
MASILKKNLILPVAQILLAVGLMRLSPVLERASWRHCDMPGPDPAFLVLIAVNAPVNLARILWDHWLTYPWNLAAWIAGVGLLWYWIARSIELWRKRHEALLPQARYARLPIDALLIVMALLFSLMGVGEAKEIWDWAPISFRGSAGCFGAFWWSELLRSLVAASMHFGWCGFLIVIFGRDFVRCFGRKQSIRRVEL